MKRVYVWLPVLMLIAVSACMDKPTGESDDPAVELNELTFDRLYSTSDVAGGEVIFDDSKSVWKGNAKSDGKDIAFSIIMPEGFVIPDDPDAPDTMPAKVKNIELFVMIADAEGNSILEARTSGDLSARNSFRYELPDLAFRNVSKGSKTFKVKTGFSLRGSAGSQVGSTLAEWSFDYNRVVPAIYKTTVNFSEFRLTDALYDRSKSNNDGLGNPLPDLYWTFKAENLDNFKSSTFENSNPYFVEKLSFNFYHLQKDAPILIEVWDDDYTSFNDKLAEWKGSLSQLQDDKDKSLQVKGLDYFKIHAGKPVVSNP